MANVVRIKRGLSAAVPALTLEVGEFAYAKDTKELYIGNDGGVKDLINKKYGTAADKDVGNSAGKIPVVGVDGKLDNSIIPALAITDTFTVATQAAMLALNAQVGDIAIRTDESKTYILSVEPASVLANWKLLLTPINSVISVNGKTGVVVVTQSDVGLGNVTNESKATMFTNPAFTGNPTGVTRPVGDNSTSLATTAFVKLQQYVTQSDLSSLSIDGGTF